MDLERLSRQIEFLVEIDRLKTIVRQTLLVDGSRQEDSAEHSWHLAFWRWCWQSMPMRRSTFFGSLK